MPGGLALCGILGSMTSEVPLRFAVTINPPVAGFCPPTKNSPGMHARHRVSIPDLLPGCRARFNIPNMLMGRASRRVFPILPLALLVIITLATTAPWRTNLRLHDYVPAGVNLERFGAPPH